MFKNLKKLVFISIAFSLFALTTNETFAATLKLNPGTGIYSAGSTFTVSVSLNTDGKSVNASDGQLTFNPLELQVISLSRSSSIFNLWTEEPSFSNAKGTINFGGGSPTGYKGANGSILNITFRALAAGNPKVNFANGSALAADGMGTNVLTSMSGGTYTVSAKSDAPAPEYIPPANTPLAPIVTSKTHSDETKWYVSKNIELSWEIPKEVTSLRMLLDDEPATVPTKVYDDLVTEKTIEDLSEGTSYFHLQFKNKEGWGRIKHFRINVDSEAPKNVSITELEGVDTYNPIRTLLINGDDVSSFKEYVVRVDANDPYTQQDTEKTRKITLESLSPGNHTINIEVVDEAGNKAFGTYSLTIQAFEKPIFIEYPTRINTEVIPAIKGKTRPKSTVYITVVRGVDTVTTVNADSGQSDNGYMVTSNDDGEFIFIPDGPFEQGVYSIKARAKDSFGGMSEFSDPIKLIVEVPGYIAFGSIVVSVLSVIVPSVALIILLIFGSWYLWHKLSMWRKRVFKETKEAEEQLVVEFDILVKKLNTHVVELKESRKNKLTKAESALITSLEEDIKLAREKIGKEIEDIEHVIN